MANHNIERSAGVNAHIRIAPTRCLYQGDSDLLETETRVLAVRGDSIAPAATCFYPGGGGQPCDIGQLVTADGTGHAVTGIRVDAGDVLWHDCDPPPDASRVGQLVRLRVDAERRLALTRHHTVLHVLNTLALREFGALITGVQIGTERSRIDFKVEGFGPAMCRALEAQVNAVLARNHAIRAWSITEAEFRARDDLRRTLTAEPPVRDGRVRVVEIVGFDAQACGGTHVHRLAELGRFEIVKTENKGRINKRLYVRLHAPTT